MGKPVVSLVRFRDSYSSLKEALELCNGLEGFQKNDKILIKPNLVSWDFDLPFPPFGVVTTSAVIGSLVQILTENGFRDITIGEAPLPILKPKGRSIFKVLGYEKLQEKYGVKLVDFNEDKFEEVDFGDFKLSVAREALGADKIINVPVLKTHNQAKVSLGIKNLKGCLNRKSKMFCHGVEHDLHHTFNRIIEKLPVALTIIDGIFTLERGPSHTGKAIRKDLLIASRDPFACDLAGAEVMGYRAEDVPHLKHYAVRHGYSLHVGDYEIRGEDLEKIRSFVDYDWEWADDNTGPAGFKKRGVTGLAVRKYDDTLCTGCSVQYNPMLLLLLSAFKGHPFPNVEVVSGKKQRASKGFEKTILFGKCACDLNKDNPDIKQAVPVPGCPPDLKKFEEILKREGINCDYNEYVNYRHYIFKRYQGREGFDLALYNI